MGAQIDLAVGATIELDLDPGFEHGVLVDTGSVVVAGQPVKPAEMAYVEPGSSVLRLEALEATRVVLLGGPPFGEQIVMWWNFIGRSHDEVAAFRAQWQAEVIEGTAAAGRFGVVRDDHLPPIPAPPLPTARLKPRS